MRKLLFVLFTLTLGLAVAKPPKKDKLTPDQKADKVVAKMDSVVDLTPEQEKQIHALTLEKIEKIKPIRKDKSLTKEQKKEKIKPIRKETKEEVSKILTAEQQAKWKAYKKEQRAKKKGSKEEMEILED